MSQTFFLQFIQNSFPRRTLSANARKKCSPHISQISLHSDHPLEIEDGRHKGIPEEDRICQRCGLNCIENEEHFVLTCNACDEPRDKLLLLFGNGSLTLGMLR